MGPGSGWGHGAQRVAHRGGRGQQRAQSESTASEQTAEIMAGSPARRRHRLSAHRGNQSRRNTWRTKWKSRRRYPCPEVEIVGGEIRIRETGNLAVLKKEEWNVLVDLILSGQLSKFYARPQ